MAEEEDKTLIVFHERTLDVFKDVDADGNEVTIGDMYSQGSIGAIATERAQEYVAEGVAREATPEDCKVVEQAILELWERIQRGEIQVPRADEEEA